MNFLSTLATVKKLIENAYAKHYIILGSYIIKHHQLRMVNL